MWKSHPYGCYALSIKSNFLSLHFSMQQWNHLITLVYYDWIILLSLTITTMTWHWMSQSKWDWYYYMNKLVVWLMGGIIKMHWAISNIIMSSLNVFSFQVISMKVHYYCGRVIGCIKSDEKIGINGKDLCFRVSSPRFCLNLSPKMFHNNWY